MTLLATSDNPHFVASRFEVDYEGITYTADTLRRLRKVYPSNVEFSLLLVQMQLLILSPGKMHRR